jgi:outer membrane protein
MLKFPRLPLLVAPFVATMIVSTGAEAQDSASGSSWFSGDWSLTVGAAIFGAPDYEGSDQLSLSGMPLVSLGRRGSVKRFSSLNDSASFAIIDTGVFRIGPAAKVLLPRDDGDSDDLRGLDDVPWGIEAGAFADIYPVDWLRLRAEVRHGIHAHHGVVADFAADAFTNVMPNVRLSGGPRLALATAGYFDAYYGVDAEEAIDSGLSEYDPGGGLRSAGLGGAVTWEATDKITTSIFAEYSRLLGPAADSSLVEERGSANQFKIGVSATYRFDFSL